jgi:pyruvate,water dikinase
MRTKKRSYITNLSVANNDLLDIVGIRANNLNMLSQNKIPISTGFMINSNVFDDVIVANSLTEKILEIIDGLKAQNPRSIKKGAQQIYQLIKAAEIPVEIQKEIIGAYKNISGFSESFVNIYPSAVNEDLVESNYDDEPLFFKDVVGQDAVIEKTKDIWASLFSEKALYYREINNYNGELSIAVLVQKAIPAESSGTAYSIDPTDNNPALIEVQSIYGLKNFDNNDYTPADTYKVSKKNLDIIEKSIVTQNFMYVRSGKKHGDIYNKINISPSWRQKQKIDNSTIINIAQTVKLAEDLFDRPVQLSWAKEADRIFITEVEYIKQYKLFEDDDYLKKPASLGLKSKIERKKLENKETVLKQSPPKQTPITPKLDIEKLQKPIDELKFVLIGTGNQKGVVWGSVKLISRFDDLADIDIEDIVVIKDGLDITKDDLRNHAFKGLITETASFNLDVPEISSAFRAEGLLRENEIITVDAETGKIYLGIGKKSKQKTKQPILEKKKVSIEKQDIVAESACPAQEEINTTVETFLLIDQPIALPKKLTNIDGAMTLNSKLTTELAIQLDSKPLIVNLNYKSENSDNFKSSLKQIHQIRNQENLRNIWICLAYIKTPNDLVNAKKIMATVRMRRSSTFKLIILIDNLASIFNLEDILKNNVDGVILDLNQIIIETYAEYNEKYLEQDTIKNSIKEVLTKANRENTKVWLKADLTEDTIVKSIKAGVFGFIVRPEQLLDTRKIIAKNEVASLKKKKRKTKR